MVDLKAFTAVSPEMLRQKVATHYVESGAMAAPIRAKLDKVVDAYSKLGLDPGSALSNEALTTHIATLGETPDILDAKKLLLDDKHNTFFNGLVEQGALDRSEKLKDYFLEHETSGGWRDTRFSNSRGRYVPANPSFPLDHLTTAQQEQLVAGLKEEFKHSGFIVEVAQSSTTGYKSVYVMAPRGSDRIIDGNTITKRMAERLEKGTSQAAVAEKETFDAIGKMFDSPAAVEPLKQTEKQLEVEAVEITEKAVVKTEQQVVRGASRTAGAAERSGTAALGNMERQAVNAAEHSGGRLAQYALIAGAALAGAAMLGSYFRKKPAPAPVEPKQALPAQSYTAGDFGMGNPAESWTSRVEAGRGYSLER